MKEVLQCLVIVVGAKGVSEGVQAVVQHIHSVGQDARVV